LTSWDVLRVEDPRAARPRRRHDDRLVLGEHAGVLAGVEQPGVFGVASIVHPGRLRGLTIVSPRSLISRTACVSYACVDCVAILDITRGPGSSAPTVDLVAEGRNREVRCQVETLSDRREPVPVRVRRPPPTLSTLESKVSAWRGHSPLQPAKPASRRASSCPVECRALGAAISSVAPAPRSTSQGRVCRHPSGARRRRAAAGRTAGCRRARRRLRTA